MKPVQEDDRLLSARRKHIWLEYAFWANFFWTLPAILYMSADFVYFVSPATTRIGGYLRFAAAISTVIDWFFFMLDWHQGHEEDAVMRKAALRETAMDPVMTWMVQVDWYLHSNITFLVAACAYMGQSVIDLYVPGVDQRTYFILDVFCTHSWLVSSLQVVAGWHVRRLSQRRLDVSQYDYVMFKQTCWPLCTEDPMAGRRSPSVQLLVDWSGWGDWVFVASSSVFVANTYLNQFHPAISYDEPKGTAIDLAGNTLDLTNSFLYFYAFLHFYNRAPLARRDGPTDAIPLMEANDSADSLGPLVSVV